MDESLLMGLYAAASMRAVDAAAIDGLGIPGGHLMERAGAAVADEILERFDPESVVVYAGKGNNGGDGFVVARELFNAGCDVVVYAIAGRAGYKGDALLNLKILDQMGVEVREGIGEDDDLTLELADVVVDAIFGTGFTGAAKGVEAAAIERIDQAAAVVSIDIASGVGASTGTVCTGWAYIKINGPFLYVVMPMRLS